MNRLKFELDRLGMSQTALSKESGVNRVISSDLVNGKETPYPKWRNAIAKAVGWVGDPSRLFEEVEIEDR